MRHDEVELGSGENYESKFLFYMDELTKEFTNNEKIEESPSIEFHEDEENDILYEKQTKYEPDEIKSYNEKGKKDKDKGHKCHAPSIRINCDLEVNVDNRNKIIYVCPDKLQYFTANAICCFSDKTIELEYSGHNTVCVYGEVVISGCLGYYKIVKSGIIFIPRHKLSKFNSELFPTDILRFRIKEKCDEDDKFDKYHKDRNEKYDEYDKDSYEKDGEYDKHDWDKYDKWGKDDKYDKEKHEKHDQYLEFDVVFTYSKCVDCGHKKCCKWY